MNCPHCGAELLGESDADLQIFKCGTEIIGDEWQSIPADCYERQIYALKAELAEHKTALNLCQMALRAERYDDMQQFKAEALEAIGQIIKDLKAKQ